LDSAFFIPENPMLRVSLLILASLLPLPLAWAARPNIVVLVSDDHRYDVMSCAGNPYIDTPHLDRVAAEGAMFRNAFATSGVCSPSRATILTGRYAHRASAPTIVWTNHSFYNHQTTFAQVLQESGYTTAHFGKSHLGAENLKWPGYDRWVSYLFVSAGENTMLYADGEPLPTTGPTDDLIAAMAADYIRETAGDRQPFMVYVGLAAPHLPFYVPERHKNYLDDVTIPKPATYDLEWQATGRHPAFAECLIDITTFQGGGIPKFGDYQTYVKNYYRSAKVIDDAAGTLLAALDETGTADNTIFIYLSDQGYALGDHGLTEKHFGYDPSARIPFLVRYPGVVPAGATVERLVVTNDIAPTLAAVAGTAMPHEVDGLDFLALFAGDPAQVEWRREFMFDQWSPGIPIPGQNGIRTDEFKLLTYPYIDDLRELYDLRVDPLEIRNVYHDPDYADVRADLETRLDEYRTRLDWAPRVNHPVERAWVLSPAPTAEDAEHLLTILPGQQPAFDPATDRVAMNGRVYAWVPAEMRKGAVSHISPVANAEPESDLFVTLDIQRRTAWDPYVELVFATPVQRLRGWWRGQLFEDWLNGPPNWAFRFNPPVDERGAIVLVHLPGRGSEGVSIGLAAPAGALK
jgi:arylsulfatase A-like enzyme